ncbi:putative phosphoenolpyruvate synthase regulatory protein [Pigmentiphaga litoralis]|jgi:regulator of PEP synthase PpsR (kinase-PPPase family)|uniref:posphoenolpyruvate synthetase regulatory kinase/phosphorylase PpsR n=1 Tax=Pigmentiphaga litoralis TaxID=516702 RepID=UPI00167BCB81|nr:pyruvate, water dikinase regulatory protein [Pigmentiphaga litoralis]GGX02505.1 putative phosphoenolpyruvate synthase regulatory protein [Pigmentiphaga litoralis]
MSLHPASTQPYIRTVYVVSDGTGITAETFAHSVLAQFEGLRFKHIRLPFIDSVDKAADVAARIDQTFEADGKRPIVFSTLVNSEINTRVRQANGMFLELFSTFVEPIEAELGFKSSHSIGRSHNVANTEQYQNRIEAINFSLAHDDGQYAKGIENADVILVGVSRCGKTPTSLYLAMQYGIKAANVPLIPDDFERDSLPSNILPYKSKLFGLTIQPERLSEVRHERRPDSRYASLENCRYEVSEAEKLMRREGIRWLSTTTKSIEEISTTVLQKIGLEGRFY